MKLVYFLFLCTLTLFAQNKTELSNQSEISILTCGPGSNDLYSSFGHNAIRVKDKINKIDRVYNYGTFDFDTPNFYLKFCQGKLLYQLSSYDYKYFPYSYYKENRWIKSQTLNFSKSQNQKLFDYLEWNALPKNKKYQYDFFYDNCATKMHEVIENSVGAIDFNYTNFPNNLTHRNLIHLYLRNNSWAKFGIDLALGSVIDKKATFKQYLFLPDYIYSGLQESSLDGVKTISKDGFILPDILLKTQKTTFLGSPLFVSILILVISILFNYKKLIIGEHLLMTFYGFLGIIIFSLWFLTEHSTTKMNMNLLWASPLLLLFPFVKQIFRRIISFLGILQVSAMLIIAITGFQEFNLSIYILAITITIIYTKQLLLSSKI